MTALGNKSAKNLKRVVVAMSGGVDSSVVAALLAAAGHEVIGITLQLYDHGAATGRKGACCAGQDIHDARRVASALGIPHYVLDYEQRFEAAVMQSFADSYIAGETPIPCVACNQQVKFTDLLSTVDDLGADVLATGHYIDRRDGDEGPALFRAADPERDQSYFLFATSKAQLERLWFPLGHMPKSEVRAVAAKLGLAIADKPDSQDICFVPSGRYTDVIERLRPDAAEPGDIVHVDGRVLGRHRGVIHYTVGQRRGLNISVGEPLYVVHLDAPARRVIVGGRDHLETTSLSLRDINWIGSEALAQQAASAGIEIAVRVRSSAPPKPATVHIDVASKTAQVRFNEGELGVAVGQACVFYADQDLRAQLLGGGWIAETTRTAAIAPTSNRPAA